MKRIKKFLYYFTTFLVILLVLSLGIDRYYLRQYEDINENLVVVDNDTDEVLIDDTYSSNDELSVIERYRLEYGNSDIIGTISIVDTDFKMLLVQGSDNSYYLNHLVNKEVNKLGSIFVDYRTDLDGRKINIYGHNNGNKSISFNILINYLDKSYYDKYRLIEIETIDSVERYEIFSVQVVNNNNHMKISFTDMEWKLYLEDVFNNSIYSSDVDVDDINKFITLQTCTNNNDNEFLLVHGRKI